MTRPVSVEFFFDCSSPWTYLAFHNIQPIAQELQIDIDYRPFLVGGVFNAVNETVYQARENPVPAKEKYLAKDLADWARASGLTIVWPPSIFPVRAVDAMRACLAAKEKGALVPLAGEIFRAYWSRDEDISDWAVLASCCEAAGLDPAAMRARAASDEIKQWLRDNTDEAVRRGAFGSPTIFVDSNDMYFGNDRLPLVRRAVERAKTG